MNRHSNSNFGHHTVIHDHSSRCELKVYIVTYMKGGKKNKNKKQKTKTKNKKKKDKTKQIKTK